MQTIRDLGGKPDDQAKIDVEPDVQSYVWIRSTSDLYIRSKPGPIFYLLACAISFWLAGYIRQSWLVMLPPALAFGLLGYLRIAHRPPEAQARQSDFERWKSVHWAYIHTGSILWSVVAMGIGWLEKEPNQAVIVSVITTITFSTAASHAFAMHPWHARICVMELIVPSILLYIWGTPNLQATGITLCIFFSYLLINVRTTSREYQKQMDVEVMLIRSRAEISSLSMTDVLTGLPNRRKYEQAWQSLWYRAARKQEVLGLILVDLDHFKRINDEFGHLAGDTCLQHFAQVLKRHVRRESDIAARIGGEEFVIIMPSCNKEQLIQVAENLRADLQKTPCQLGTVQIVFTASMGTGLADWQNDDSPDLTFQRIDKACYQAKASGRNRVVAV
ncbi:GGDEF domain-containing protein [Undibacterium rugosum]|uniref:diguanylate cyclase n=1 Tax=Undibacterium rugosum TaxID=2762291 RepID=A0A923I3S1_9BURK|nr:GGDEF domain-containing protein [Undibacterium rugosum]MBC3935982.1 GGDEF domain-containing protein [Undibacterium rugosum]MBR7778685.1 GGDEF domain-containing protein [Undibacterium rugosum]